MPVKPCRCGATLAFGLAGLVIVISTPASMAEDAASNVRPRVLLAQLSIPTPFGNLKIKGPAHPKRKADPPAKQEDAAPAEAGASNTAAQPAQPSEGQATQPAQAARAAPAPGALPTFQDCDVCPKMAIVPPGSFMMGATNEDRSIGDSYTVSFELPRHRVDIGYSFGIGVYELTVAEYAAFVSETGLSTVGECLLRTPDSGPNRRKFLGTLKRVQPDTMGAVVVIADGDFRQPGAVVSDRHPATCFSLQDARQYLEWLSKKTGKKYRLPTEAEWEYAARAGTTTAFHFGKGASELCKYANFADRASPYTANVVAPCAERPSPQATAPVGSYAPNAWGLYDMFGNVGEAIEGCVFKNYDGAPTDGSPWRTNSKNETCLSGAYGRGFFFDSIYTGLRSATRATSAFPEDTGGTIRANWGGLRVAVSLDDKAWDRR